LRIATVDAPANPQSAIRNPKLYVDSFVLAFLASWRLWFSV
jgi:hypothetical protein